MVPAISRSVKGVMVFVDATRSCKYPTVHTFEIKSICKPDFIIDKLQNVSLKKTLMFAFTVAFSFEVCLKELYYISFKQTGKYKLEPVIPSYSTEINGKSLKKIVMKLIFRRISELYKLI